jgi:hypothetical protein
MLGYSRSVRAWISALHRGYEKEGLILERGDDGMVLLRREK